ncbi:MAG: hypothetical protein RR357_05970 [Clostridia bacterium]
MKEKIKNIPISSPDSANTSEDSLKVAVPEVASVKPNVKAKKAETPKKASKNQKNIAITTTAESVTPVEETVDTTKNAKNSTNKLAADNSKTVKANTDKSAKKTKKKNSSDDIFSQAIVISSPEEAKKVSTKNSKGRTAFKVFMALISVALMAGSGYLFLQVFDFNNPLDLEKLYLVAPLAAQILIGIILLIGVATGKKRVSFIQYISEKSDAKEAAKEAKAEESAHPRADLLKPEVDLTTRPNFKDSSYNIDSYYKKTVEEINGKIYTSISTFDESIRALESMGATDMELIKVNMTGNDKFTEILDQARTPTLSSKELALYFMSKPGAYTIKKRGALNWTFKYSFKSFGMIRENQDSYKVSIKCYPDAAAKLNEKYMALEDSNFPSGPLWFCFNELRNLPPRVCKWLIDTSFQISRLQQIKTDKLRDFKTPADLDINFPSIIQSYKEHQNVIVYPKFTLIFTTGGEADLTTYLSKPVIGVDTEQFTKEYYYKFKTADLAVSFLCGKTVSDEMIATFMEHVEEILM